MDGYVKQEDPNADGVPGERYHAVATMNEGTPLESTVENWPHTEGYGPWPKCDICAKPVEPSQYSNHQKDHMAAARGDR